MIGSNDEQTMAQIFEQAIEIEIKAASMYRKYTELFSHIPKMSAFWSELTKEEMDHANTLRAIHKSLTAEQLQVPCSNELLEKVKTTQRMLNNDLTASINNLDEAYELAHELEFSEINAIFRFLAIEFVSNVEREQFIVSQIEQHQQKLIDFSSDFGSRAWRKGISAN